jgi:hypothetical protein
VPGETRKTAAQPLQPSQTAPKTPANSRSGPPNDQAVTPFAGRWFFYAASAHDPRTSGMYPSEFIEFFLSEDQGVLSGEYWRAIGFQ